MPRHLTLLTLCFSALLPPMVDAGPDRNRLLESTLTQRADLLGDVIELTAADRRLMAVYRNSFQPQARGAVLLLHAPGSNADDTRVIRPLRLGLSEAGWNTLVLQLPPAFANDSAARWLTRNGLLNAQIDAGLAWLKTQGQLNQVLLGVGAAASAALARLGQDGPKEVQALVLVSAPLVEAQRDLQNLTALTVPVLDVFAERDHADVTGAAPAKRRAAVASTSYSQRTVPGASAGYEGAADHLVAQVRAWLAAHADGRTRTK